MVSLANQTASNVSSSQVISDLKAIYLFLNNQLNQEEREVFNNRLAKEPEFAIFVDSTAKVFESGVSEEDFTNYLNQILDDKAYTEWRDKFLERNGYCPTGLFVS